MAKTVLYRLFGLGGIPAPLLTRLKGEGLLLLDEGVRGSVTYRDFRAPGRYSHWKRQWYTSSIALTRVRLVALRRSSPVIDVPLADERIRRLRLSLEGDDTLLVAFDASLFHGDWSGIIEYRFRTPRPQHFIDAVHERVAGQKIRRQGRDRSGQVGREFVRHSSMASR